MKETNFIFSDIFSFFAEIILFYKFAQASSKYFHDTMLHSLLRSTMQFFESTPIGRILNRFTKDLTAIEFQLPCSFKDVVYSVLDALSNIILISYSTPLFLIVIVPLAIIYLIILVTIIN